MCGLDQRRRRDRVVPRSERRQQVEEHRERQSAGRIPLEQVEHRQTGVAHRASGTGPAIPRRRRSARAARRCCSGSSVWSASTSMSARVAPACSSTQLPRMPSSGAGSSIGRWVWAPLVAAIVRYMPASSLKCRMTRRIRARLLRGSTPEMITRPVLHARRAAPPRRDGSIGCRQCRSAVSSTLRVTSAGRRLVGEHDRVGQLPIDDRDRQPRTRRRLLRSTRSAAGARTATSVHRSACHDRYWSSKSPFALPSPRGWIRVRTVPLETAVQQLRNRLIRCGPVGVAASEDRVRHPGEGVGGQDAAPSPATKAVAFSGGSPL